MNLAGISSFWQQLATGGILILVVVFNKITENHKLQRKKNTGKADD